MPITYITGDATAPIGDDRRLLVHICNDAGKWGRGFVMEVSRRWPNVRTGYLKWYRLDAPTPFALGQTQIAMVESNIWVVNLIGQHGVMPQEGIPPIRYNAVRRGLATVRDCALALNASVHMPRIGCGLAGGTWDRMLQVIDEELLAFGLDVFVYDRPT